MSAVRKQGVPEGDPMSDILALDPGFERSALVHMRGVEIVCAWLEPNDQILERLRSRQILEAIGWHEEESSAADVLVIERIAGMGMAVGAEVFETCVWTGRFMEAWGGEVVRIPRRQVKLHLCGSMRAKDANIRAVLIDRYGPGKEKAIGRKATPGPLYGLKADMFAALAVGVTYLDQLQEAKSA